jgi:hypothetical protein
MILNKEGEELRNTSDEDACVHVEKKTAKNEADINN